MDPKTPIAPICHRQKKQPIRPIDVHEDYLYPTIMVGNK